MDLEIIKTKLLLGKNISFGESEIHQPTVDSIDEITEIKFNQIVSAFGMNLDILQIPSEIKDKVKIFDLYFMPNVLNISGVEQILPLIEGLCFFFKTQDISINDKQELIIDKKTIINRDNFEDLQDIILKICCAKRAEKPKEKVFKNAKQKEIHDRIQKARRQYAKEKKIDNLISVVINELVHEDGKFTYQNIGNFTLWQLMNSLSIMRIKDEYKTNLSLVGNMTDTSKINLSHWKERILNEIEY